MTSLCFLFIYILKTESNFTVFITEYFYSCFDLIQINYLKQFPRPAQTEFKNDDLCKLFRCRVICAFIKNKQLAFSQILKYTKDFNTQL